MYFRDFNQIWENMKYFQLMQDDLINILSELDIKLRFDGCKNY